MGDYLLIGLVVAYFGWRVLSVIRVRRQLPVLRAAGAQRDGGASAAAARVQTRAECGVVAEPAVAGGVRAALHKE